jgi:hypothetical protein
MCKVQYSHHIKKEATCEREEELKAEFLSFFSDPSESQDEIHFKGGRFVTRDFHKGNKTLKII